MSLSFWVVTNTIKGVTHLLCSVNTEQICKVPAHGPLILVCNHINFLDVPLVFCHLQPRPVTGFAKVETWNNPWMAALFNLWGGIPIRRGEADCVALRAGLEALKRGKILTITPEGTRSGDGCLLQGHPGVVMLALHSGAPLLPLVYWGNERFHSNLRRLRRTPFHVRVGQLFRLDDHGERVTHTVRQAMTDEMMCQLAALLPPEYHGFYAGKQPTTTYLRFLDSERI